MKNQLSFGERIEGYSIPVLNEREIRAASGIMFVFALMSLVIAQVGNEIICYPDFNANLLPNDNPIFQLDDSITFLGKIVVMGNCNDCLTVLMC